MDKLQIFAAFLLLCRIIATIVLGGVLKRQLHYFKTTYTEAPRIRKGLFFLVVAATITQIVPIIVDIAGTLDLWQLRSAKSVKPIGLAYSFSNATLSLVTAFGWRYLYDIIEQDQVKVISAKKHTDKVERENTKLKRYNKKH